MSLSNFRALGRSGLVVSPLCLGTMTFGPGDWGADEDASREIFNVYRNSGGNFVDTADIYSGGVSEEFVGKFIEETKSRDEIVLATKFGFNGSSSPLSGSSGAPGNPHAGGAGAKNIHRALDASLNRLGTDYIDLYQIHHPDPTTDIEETLGALTDLLASGKVRVIGTSNFPASEIVEAQWVSDRRGLARFRTEQPPYSILNRGAEKEVFPVCEKYGLGALVWSPLAMGLLTGKYRKGGPVKSTRLQWVPKHLTDAHTLDIVEQLIGVAEEAGLSLTAMAMAFTVAHPAVTSAIVGPRTMEQLDGLLSGANTALDDDLLDRIDQIAPPGSDTGLLDVAYRTPAVREAALRRRPAGSRSAS